METVYFPVACTIAFAHSGIRRIAARSLHSFTVEKFGASTVNLTAPDGTVAYGVWNDTFERLPAGYTWVKFKVPTTLCTAVRDAQLNWKWQCGQVDFSSNEFYAIKIESTGIGDCHITTKDGKICPYTACRYFDAFSAISEVSKAPRFKSVLEAFPAPVRGTRSEFDPEVWHAPSEYDGIPVVTDHYRNGSFRHPTLKPVAALRLDFDEDRNPIYRCGYFGPAPE